MSSTAESANLSQPSETSSDWQSKARKQLAALLAEKRRRSDTNRLGRYQPYPKQREFHDAGAEARERLFMAGNQLGKTIAGGAEWAMHLTGRYPDWWQGKAFDKPVALWAAGITNESTRDNPQRILVGPPALEELWGTGMIPGNAIVEVARASHGIRNAIDSVVVEWGGGGDTRAGDSILGFKSYEKGRGKWQGETLEGVWFDEEPPLDIYSEGLTRTNATGGITIVTFTPLLGLSEVVMQFLSSDQIGQVQSWNGEPP